MGGFKLGASFFFFWIANVCLIITAFTMIGLGGYIWHITDNISFFDIGLVVLGVIEIFLAIIACYSKDSKARLQCYFYTLSLIFVAQLTVSIIGVALGQKAFTLANKYYNDPNFQQFQTEIKNNAKIAFYGTLGADGVQLICIILANCYRNMLKDDDLESRHKLIQKTFKDDQEAYQKVAKAKADEKRQKLYEKYPEMKEQLESKNNKGNKDKNSWWK